MLESKKLRILTILLGLLCAAGAVLWYGPKNMQILGFIAAISTTCAFIPQVVKTVKSKDTRSISLGMYCLLVFGVFCWLSYGALLGDLPMMLANSITLVLACIVLWLKLTEGSR